MKFSPIFKLIRSFTSPSKRLLKDCLASPSHRTFATNAFQPPKKRSIPWMQWGFFFGCTGAVAYFSTYAVGPGREKFNQATASLGQIAIGGDFRLIDQTGKERTLADFKGKWIMVYFGFCRCPDICPEQLERLVEVHERLGLYGKNKDFVPIFITIDPERDTPEVINEYVKEFSPKLVALTGSKDQINVVAKRYRIYHSKGPIDSDGDYIVDHTVVMYLLNPRGEFIEYFGQLKPVQEIVRRIMDRMKSFTPND